MDKDGKIVVSNTYFTSNATIYVKWIPNTYNLTVNPDGGTIYYSDGFEIITSWFPGFILRNNVSLSLLARGAVEDGVSATQVREFIMTDDDRLKHVVPTSVYENKESIKQLITLSKLKQ